MKNKYAQLISQKLIQTVKNNSINDSKWQKRRMALSCSKKTIKIIKRNNIKTWRFLLFQLSSFSSFFKNKK